MKKIDNKQFIRFFITDYKKIVCELYSKKLLRDHKEFSIKNVGNIMLISRPLKKDESNILFDTSASIDDIMDMLLKKQEYSFLLYDKSIIQAEFEIDDGKIKKERLIFIKKHNHLWAKEEIFLKDIDEFGADWFYDEKGIPVMIRVDFDYDNYQDVVHPITHMTLSNYEECRIPMMKAVSLFDFVNFILNVFYKEELGFSSVMQDDNITITDNERKRLHFEWQ